MAGKGKSENLPLGMQDDSHSAEMFDRVQSARVWGLTLSSAPLF